MITDQAVKLTNIAADTSAAIHRQMCKHGLTMEHIQQVETPEGIDYCAKGGGVIVRVTMKNDKTIIEEAR